MDARDAGRGVASPFLLALLDQELGRAVCDDALEPGETLARRLADGHEFLRGQHRRHHGERGGNAGRLLRAAPQYADG